MQITRVELRNVKNHAAAEWDFQPGVIAICGPNGSGKTTILESIAWALFDHLDYKREDFIKRGTKKGQVTVNFISDLDQREYLVQRDTGGGYFVYDPVTKIRLVEQKNQVVPWLRQHIGVEPGADLPALFKTTVGVPQGTFTYAFTLRPGDRKTVFDQILKVEEYRHASDQLRETVRHVDDRLAESDRRLAEASGELKSYDQVKARYDEAAARGAQIEADLRAAQVERERAAAAVSKAEELRRSLEAARITLERLGERLVLTRDRLARAREAAARAREAAALVEAARAGYEGYLEATRRLSTLEGQRAARDDLRRQLSTVERSQVEIEAQIRSYRERLAEIGQARTELEKLNGQIATQAAIEAQIAAWRESRGRLASLRQALEPLDRELLKLRDRYAQIARQHERAIGERSSAERVPALEEERARLDREINEAEVALGHARLRRDHLDQLQRERERLQREREERVEEAWRLGQLAATAARVAELEADHLTATSRLATLRAEVARDEEMITGLERGGICPLLTEKCLNLNPGESLDGRFREGLVARREEIAALGTQITRLTASLKAAQTAAADSSHLPRVKDEMARLARALDALEEQVVELEREIGAGLAINEESMRALRDRRAAIDRELRAARDSQQLYLQAELFAEQMAEIRREGETKRQERDALATQAAALGDPDAALEAAALQLSALDDPRGRGAALAKQIAGESSWQAALDQAARRADQLTAEFQRLTTEIEPYGALDAELARQTERRAQLERDYQTFIAHEQTGATAGAREAEAEAEAAEHERSEAARAEAAAAHDSLLARYDEAGHLAAQEAHDLWRERSTQLATQLEHAREEVTRLQSQLDHLDTIREQWRRQTIEREQAARLREATEFIRETLQKAVPYITESYLLTISREANQLFREITGRHDVTLRWKRDYEITLEEEGHERPFANLSGGEQMAAALAVRLALLKELTELRLAFFDEPTTNMDEERRRNLAQQIGRVRHFDQLFVISHDDSFEGATDQVIMLGEQ